ncbi:hypothetical protein AB0I60_10270 [Actinosynnema sp. NPDC050436]
MLSACVAVGPHRALLDALDRLASDVVPTRSGRDRVAGLLHALKIADT